MNSSGLTEPLHDVAAWTSFFRDREIPVLAESAQALESWRQDEDAVDANLIGETFARDPLMTLRVLVHAAMNRPPRVVTDPETVTAAVVMMGISPFFRMFQDLATVEQWLGDEGEALDGLRAVLRRARRAANFALGFAVRRMDPDAAAVHNAALLHDFVEMLIWCHAPTLALRTRAAQQADPAARSIDAQMRILNISVADLQQSLMQAWRLPELLTRISDDRHARHPSERSVLLAVRLARHTARGWDGPAVAEDIREVSQLLHMTPEATQAELHELDS